MNHTAKQTSRCASDPAGEQMLVIAAKNGDEQAFETLFKRHRQRILAVVLRYAHVREDAEDIAQQTFQKAFMHLCKFEGRSSFSTWLTRIAINEALMFLRSIGAVREVPIDDISDSEENAALLEMQDSSPNPEVIYLERERARILSSAIGNLKPGTRLAIELREFAELSTKETARCMGLSVAAVKARVFHARKKLRKTMKRYMRSRRICESNILATAVNVNCSPQNRMTCNL